MNIKKQVKNLIGKCVTPLSSAILVNSYGRSGSTLLANSIVESVCHDKIKAHSKLIKKSIYFGLWDIYNCNILNGFVYKTHDYPNLNNKRNIKCLYIFADPVEVVLSLINIYKNLETDSWMRLHFEHLKAPYVEDFYSIINYDTLRMENHFDSWIFQNDISVAFVRYESLWQNQHNISEYLNLPLQLPPYKERTAKSIKNTELRKNVEVTYSEFRNKLNSCNDFFTINC